MGASCQRPQQGFSTALPVQESEPSPNEALKFFVQLSNVRGRNLPKSSSYLKIFFANCKQFKTSPMVGTFTDYLWNFKEEFEYEVIAKDLKTSALRLVLVDNKHRDIADVTINLIDSVRGPGHIDIVLKKGLKPTKSRLIFDLKMSQRVLMSLKTLKIDCLLTENPKEREYNYSLKLIGTAKDFSSEHSSNLKNPFFVTTATSVAQQDGLPENYTVKDFDEGKRVITKNYFTESKKVEPIKPKLQEQLSLTHLDSQKPQEPLRASIDEGQHPRKTLDDVQIAAGIVKPESKKRLVWEYREDDHDIPFVDLQINSCDFEGDCLQVLLWSAKSSEKQGQPDVLVGDSLIAMNKIYVEMTNSSQKINDSKMKKEISITKKLWFHGVCIGMLEAKLLCEYSPFYRQMICGVLTDRGVQKSAEVVLNKDKKSVFGVFHKSFTVEVRNLSALKENLIENVFKIAAVKDDAQKSDKLVQDTLADLEKIHAILNKSHKASMVSFVYQTSEDLLTSQQIFIDLGRHLLEYFDKVPLPLRGLYLECLSLVILRGEFDLHFMGFESDDQSFGQSSNFDIDKERLKIKNMKQKMKVTLNYQRFIYRVLEAVLKLANQDGLDGKSRIFVTKFCASAYFRIPEFRERLLQSLEDSQDAKVEITEWRGTEYQLEGETDNRRKNKVIVSLFDWNTYFYRFLKGTQRGDENFALLSEILSDQKLFLAFEKRRSIFALFLTEFANMVSKTVVVNQNIPWQDVPGYSVLIKHFLSELKRREVRTLSKYFIDASVAILLNEKLLNIFIVIIYNKTRVFDWMNVFANLDLINTWMKTYQIRQKQLPTTFDYNFFLKGLEIIMESDHATNIAKVFWVIYNNYNTLTGEARHRLCSYLFGERFFRLFLHWSHEVRKVFYYLLLFRIYHQHRSPNSSVQTIDDIKAELKAYNQKRSNYNKFQRNLLINDYISMEYSQYMTIIERAHKAFLENVQQEKIAIKLNKKKKDHYFKLKRESSMDLGRVYNLPKLRGSMSASNMEVKVTRPVYKGDSGDSWVVLNNDRLDSSSNMGSPGPQDGILDDLDKKPQIQAEEIGISFSPPRNKKIAPFTEEQAKEFSTPVNQHKRKYPYKKLVYYDDNTEKYSEIPRELLVYLTRAIDEFDQAKMTYLKWVKELNLDLAGKTEEEKKKMLADPEVPELVIEQVSDLQEIEALQPEDQ